MKVRIELTVGVDVDEWAETYGVDPTPTAVRDDVLRWASNVLDHHPDGLIELSKVAR